jgi:hypothetical protein
MTFCASAWLFQNPGAEIACSISVSSSSRPAFSKMPPEFRRSPAQIVMLLEQFFEIVCHCPSEQSLNRDGRDGHEEDGNSS